MTEAVNETDAGNQQAVENQQQEKAAADKQQPQQETQPQYSEVQQRAMEQGWRPKEEFEGPEEMFVDAAEFLRRGELFGKIEQQRKEMAELRKTLKTMQEHHTKVRESEFKRALELLKKQKVEALKEGSEPERIVEIDDQIDQVRDALAEQKAETEREKIREQVESSAPDPRFAAWVDKNKWYGQDPELKAFADQVGIAYTKARAPGSVDPVEVLKYVEGRVRKAYPDRFKNPNRERANTVEPGDGNRSGGKKTGAEDGQDYELTAQEEKVFATLHRQDPKFWTKKRYVDDLKALDKAQR